jgi:hypothetical protein
MGRIKENDNERNRGTRMKWILFFFLIVLASLVNAIDCSVTSCNNVHYNWADFSNPIYNGSSVSAGDTTINGGWNSTVALSYYRDAVYNTSPVAINITPSGSYELFRNYTGTFNASCLDFLLTNLSVAANTWYISFTTSAKQPLQNSQTYCDDNVRTSLCTKCDNGDFRNWDTKARIDEWYTFCMYWNGTNATFSLKNSTTTENKTDNDCWGKNPFTEYDYIAYGTTNINGHMLIDNYREFNGSQGDLGISTNDITPPTLSNPVCTSCPLNTNNTVDSTPTVNVTCIDDISSCQMVRIANDSSLSFASATSSRNCTSGSGDTWVCTLPATDALSTLDEETPIYFWANDTAGNNHTVYNLTINITLQNPHLKLDSSEDNRTYEFETTANLSTNYLYFDILDDTDRYLNETTSPFNYTIDLLRINKFNDSNESHNILCGEFKSVHINNKTDLYNVTINLTGTGEPENISINYTNYVFLPGTLIGNNLYQKQFIYKDINNDSRTLVFSSAESKTIYINYSTQGNVLNRTGFFNFTLTAYSIDINNELDYENDFGNESINEIKDGIVLNGTVPVGMWENFVDNDTLSNWQGSPTYETGADTYYLDWDYYLYKTTGGSLQEVYSNTIDLGKLSQISFFMRLTRDSVYIPDRWYHGGFKIGFYDGNEEVDIHSDGSGQSFNPSWGEERRINFTFYKTSSTDWSVHYKLDVDGVTSDNYETISVDALNSTYYLKFEIIPYISGSSQSSVSFRVFYFNYSGIWLNRSLTGNFSGVEGSSAIHSGNYTSQTINHTTDNIVSAFLNATVYEPDNTVITYWLSNDNGSTWESAVNGDTHTFSSSDKKLRVRFKLNTTDGLTSPAVYSYNVKVIPSPLTSLRVDVGDNNLFSYDYELNSTSTPIGSNASDSVFNEYINYSCLGGSYCLIPVTFITGSGGILSITNLNLTENINPIRLNTSAIQTLEEIDLKLNYSNRTTSTVVKVDDLKFDYRGSKNITIYSHNSDYSSSVNYTIFAKYSPFNITFPSGVEFFEVFFSSRNQTEAEPFGQNDSTGIFDIDSTAYDGNISIWMRWNNSVHACLTTQEFRGQNFTVSSLNNISTLNITNLTISNQIIVSDLNSSLTANIRSYTTVNCSMYSFPFIPLEYFCFNSLCSSCIQTHDFQDNCEVLA